MRDFFGGTRRARSEVRSAATAIEVGRPWTCAASRTIPAGRLWFASPQGAGRRELPAGDCFTGSKDFPTTTSRPSPRASPASSGSGRAAARSASTASTGSTARDCAGCPTTTCAPSRSTRSGNAWFATARAPASIERKPMTLAEKAKFFEDEIDRYHRRTEYGYVMAVTLPNAWRQERMDAARQRQRRPVDEHVRRRRVLRLRRHQGPASQKRATQAFEALRFLSVVTQGGEHPAPRGFPARAILPDQRPRPQPAGFARTRRPHAQAARPLVEDPVAALAQERRRQVVLEIGHQLGRARRPLLLLRRLLRSRRRDPAGEGRSPRRGARHNRPPHRPRIHPRRLRRQADAMGHLRPRERSTTIALSGAIAA